jgi:predicted metalloprotease
MRWQGGRLSSNVEDRRRAGPIVVGGGLATVAILLLILCMGGDPRALLVQMQQAQQQGQGPAQPGEEPPANDEQAQFVQAVLAQTEDVWKEQFQRSVGRPYQEPVLVLFNGQTRSACGFASAAVGPFYCPADSKVYLDLSFFQDLETRFKAKGDFARAYVIAHEIGHHIQNQLGISDQVQAQRGQLSDADYNDLSVRMELQADFYAGVWAHHANQNWQILEPGDIEEALNAANAIGDDRLQMQQRGFVVPDAFTHGTSEQRVRWFTRGLKSGDMEQGDTFSVREL